MYPIETTKLYHGTRSYLQHLLTISDEFYYFLIFLLIFNVYIWSTLQYVDEFLSPLTQESIERISSSPFYDKIAKFEENCKENYKNYTLDASVFISSVLNMDWRYRLIYLFIFYQIALYFEYKYKCKLTKFISNHLITSNNQQTKTYKLFVRLTMFLLNSLLLFSFYMMDVIYTRWQFSDQFDDIHPELMDYSEIPILERIGDFMYIFIRVHPLDAWLVRISHGISYPFTIYALSRPTTSKFLYCHMLTIIFWLFHFGGIAHTLDISDMQLRCVRRSFIWSTRGTSIHGEAMRSSVAPYLNLLCLTIDCAKYFF